MDLEDIGRLNSKESLQRFLRKRGLKHSGRKKELVALVYAAQVMEIKELPSAEEKELSRDQRYKEALVTADDGIMPDPLKLEQGWLGEKEGMKSWPPTMYSDICNYLVMNGDFATLRGKLMKDYKLGKGYSYFASNWIQEVMYHPISPSSKYCFLKAKCLQSNVITAKWNLWVLIVKSTGDIASAWCRCTSGLGKTCNHVAAILFKLDHAWKYGLTDPACTSVASSWIGTSKTILPQKVKDVPWERHHYSKGITDARPLSLKRPAPDGDTPEEKRRRLASAIRDTLPNAVMLNLMKPCSYKPDEIAKVNPEHDINVVDEVEVVTSPPPPPTMQKLANQFVGDPKNKEGLTGVGFANSLKPLSTDDVKFVNKLTRGQPDSKAWREHRVGRITASVVHQVYTKVNTLKDPNSKRSKDPTPCVDKCMRTSTDISHVAEVKYGITTEPDAKVKYRKVFRKEHKGARVEECGLSIHKENQYLAASPDLFASCKCHGEGIVEVKCPFIHVKPSAGKPKYIRVLNNKYQLHRSHPYYTQIQMQLAITERAWCDFLVYNIRGYILERIYPDKTFWGKVLKNCQYFFAHHLAPVLLEQATPEEPQVFDVIDVSDNEVQEVGDEPGSSGELEADSDGEPELPEVKELQPSTRERREVSSCVQHDEDDVEMVEEIVAVESDEENRPVSPTFPKVDRVTRSKVTVTASDSNVKTTVATVGKKSKIKKKVISTTSVTGQVCPICDHDCKEVIQNETWVDKWYTCHECSKNVHFVCAGIFDDEDDALDEEYLLCPICC